MQLRHLKLEIFLIFSYRPWIQTNLALNSIEKVKPGFFFNFYVTWIEQEKTLILQFWSYTSKIKVKILISQLLSPKFRYFADQNGPNEGPHENEFWQFSNAKMGFLNSWGSKSRRKKSGHLFNFYDSFRSYGP